MERADEVGVGTTDRLRRRGARRRSVTGLVAAALVLAAAVACGSGSGGEPSAEGAPGRVEKPNFLVVLADDMEVALVDVMPKLQERVKAKGLTFSNYFISNPLCCPSRVSLLRGQFAHNTGVYSNAGQFGGYGAMKRGGIQDDTLATALQKAGYRTGLIGKYLNGYPEREGELEIPPGWDEWSVATAGAPHQGYSYTLNHNGRTEPYGKRPEDYATDVFVRQTRAFIEQSVRDDKPFFAYLNVYAPHEPSVAAPEDLDKFPGATVPNAPSYNEADTSDKPAYIQKLPRMNAQQEQQTQKHQRARMQSLQAVDRGIDALVSDLERLGQLDETYVVFSSDNGYHMGHHRVLPGKSLPYEEDIKVPFIVSGPGIAPGTTAARLAGNIDVAPTLLELAGGSLNYDPDGRSLVPLLFGRDPGPWRTSYLLERWNDAPPLPGTPQATTKPVIPEPPDQDQQTGAPAEAERGGGIRPVAWRPAADVLPQVTHTVNFGIPKYAGLRTDTYAYIEYVGDKPELYHLQTDPYQLDNVAARAPRELIDALKKRLAALSSCKGAACREAEVQPIG